MRGVEAGGASGRGGDGARAGVASEDSDVKK